MSQSRQLTKPPASMRCKEQVMGLVKTRRLAAMQKQQRAKMASNSFSRKTIRKDFNHKNERSKG